MKIGIFGGSFDPVHYGHLIMAEQCREQAGLDQVWFVPAAQQPLKPRGAVAKDKLRLEMLKLAIAGNSRFAVSTHELDRGEISYTVDTLRQLTESKPDHELYFIIGADSLEHFNRWRDPDGICRLAIPLVVRRRGSDMTLDQLEPFMEPDRFQRARGLQIESPLIEISSTDLRNQVAAGKSIRYLTPRSVEKFIEHHKLYGNAT